MTEVLNQCARCGKQLGSREVGYYRLNSKTDRFELECKHCFDYEENKPIGVA